jgi:iron complex outermembrane receptor protein
MRGGSNRQGDDLVMWKTIHRGSVRAGAACVGSVLLFALLPAYGQGVQASRQALSDLTLEQLAEVEVTSVSGHTEPLSGAAASIYVITGDDIRRSGATSLPEALRLAPNLQVARVDAGQYAISARGFNNAIGNKLLVLIDGRTVYAPFFSGVLWDAQDVMLEDVDRIEVISGPGGVLWGTNAVNGVINIVTRSAAQTQGALAVVGGGNLESDAAFRYGGALGTNGHFRVFGKTERLENTRTASGASVPDGWDRSLGGFRADWSEARDEFMLQGNASHAKSEFRGVNGSFQLTPIDNSDVNVLGSWSRKLGNGSSVKLQAYYDHSIRDDAELWRPREDIADIQVQHAFALGEHNILWGGGYRHVREDLEPGLFFGFVPTDSSVRWRNLFAQDEFKLGSRLDVTLGARLEGNDYTGVEALPSARVAWRAASETLLWAGASRAVRAPAPLDRDIRLPPRPPFIIAGGPDFRSEVANVYELGYRGRPVRDVSFSATAFYQAWSGLRSGEPPPNALVQNKIDGHTSGIEAWGSWQAAAWWRLSGGLTTLHENLRLRPDSTDPVGPSNLGDDPSFQWQFRSAFDLPARQELDLNVRRVAALPLPAVPAYTAVDLRYGWRINPTLEFSLRLRNLLDPSHPEFDAAPGRSEIGRSAFAQLRWTP